MRVIVLVNNYNYGKYINEALESVEAQTKLPDEIIVIDDGSTDDSRDKISKYRIKNNKIKLIEKENSGQLSCFNVAAKYINDEDIIFFLDSDDLYPPDYIELVFNFIDNDHDFYFAETVKFNKSERPLATSKISSSVPLSIPKSSALTRRYNTWVGSPTSAMAITGKAFKEILPYHDEYNFKTRADDVLIYSSSILGHRKKFLPFISVSYRIHGNNNFYGKRIEVDSSRRFALEMLFHEMCQRAGIGLFPPASIAYAESMCIPPSFREKFFLPSKWRLDLHRLTEKIFKFIGLR